MHKIYFSSSFFLLSWRERDAVIVTDSSRWWIPRRTWFLSRAGWCTPHADPQRLVKTTEPREIFLDRLEYYFYHLKKLSLSKSSYFGNLRYALYVFRRSEIIDIETISYDVIKKNQINSSRSSRKYGSFIKMVFIARIFFFLLPITYIIFLEI